MEGNPSIFPSEESPFVRGSGETSRNLREKKLEGFFIYISISLCPRSGGEGAPMGEPILFLLTLTLITD